MRLALQEAGGDRAVRVWDAADGKETGAESLFRAVLPAESDADFLRRVTQAARGSAPTALEEKYFAADKDPKKREKLVDLLLAEPAVAKRLGDDFKKRMLAADPLRAAAAARAFRYLQGLEAADGGSKKAVPPPPAADPFGKLIDELLAAKKSDAEVLEALTLVTAGRLPTDVEKRLTLGLVAKANDRKAAWAEVAKALAGDAKKDVIRKTVVAPVPVPPAK
jgi:hypothetical protein